MIPLVLWQLGNIAREELWDVTLLEKFKDTHFDRNDYQRRLSVYLARQIKNEDLRQQLRQFIFWDVMERSFTGKNAVSSFDCDHQDWHLLGDAIWDARHARTLGPSEPRKFEKWWDDLRDLTYRRWPDRRLDLDRLYVYLDEYYLVGPKPGPPSPTRCAEQ